MIQTPHQPDAPATERELTHKECLTLLGEVRFGRVVTTFGPDCRPLIRPVSHAYDPVSHSIVFRSVRGAKLHALLDRHDACFEVDGESGGWLWSVIARGRVETEERPGEIARLERLSRTPVLPIPDDGCWVRVRCEVLSGRRFPVPEAA